MNQKFPKEKYKCMRYFIGDVRDQTRLKLAMQDVDYVVHAAALKQVVAAEYNPMECVKTNIGGAENVVKAAMESNVSKVIVWSVEAVIFVPAVKVPDETATVPVLSDWKT